MSGHAPTSAVGPVPAVAGIGLRSAHYRDLLAQMPAVGWLEVHSENYFGLPGAPAHFLERARRDYPLSLHGIGLSLGSTDPLSPTHLARVRELVARYEPWFVSDHLCWSSVDGRYLNDLLPLPLTRAAVSHLVGRIDAVQTALGRQLLVENLSSYLRYTDDEMPEWEFVAEVARRSGCGLILDVNNVYVSACNHGFDARRYLDAIPLDRVQEMHLAGHCENRWDGGALLVDTHNAPVCEAVWELYRYAVRRFGPVPTLIEWDADLPALPALVAEAAKADRILGARHALAA